MESLRSRASRTTRETFPVPPPLLPASGPNPTVRLNPRLDVWLRQHPPDPRAMLVLAVLVVLMACARVL